MAVYVGWKFISSVRIFVYTLFFWDLYSPGYYGIQSTTLSPHFSILVLSIAFVFSWSKIK
jgi:hypothetical protein